MKCNLLLLALLLAFSSLKAQKDKDLPAFGVVDKEELLMKECDFDKNAEALVLFDVETASCDRNYTLSRERRVRIKILNDKGVDNANIHIRYRFEHFKRAITGLVAQTYNLDAAGNIITTKVEKNQVFDKPISKRYSEVVFSFPQVKAGSVIEYKYTDETETIGNWYFQKAIPVKLSRFKLDFPSTLEVTAIPHCVLPYDVQRDDKTHDGVKIYTMRNVPALRDEPYISCDDDYLQRLETTLLAINLPGDYRRSLIHTWPQVIRMLMEDEDFGQQLKKNIPRTQELDEKLKNITDPYHKMVIIHEYVRKNMQWNGMDNIWALDGVKSAWKDKKGTSGEINLIMVNLLKDAGLNAHPVLVSTKGNGRVNTAFSDYHQFDKVMAYVRLGDKTYTLDATEKYTPAKLIPLDVAGTEGLVIEKLETFEWGWKMLWNEQQEFKTNVLLNAELTPNGQLQGYASVLSDQYARLERAAKLKEGKEKYIEHYFTSRYAGIKVDSLVIENEDTDSLPLVQKFNFTASSNASGDYHYFSANLFTGLEKNPFVADSRFSDIFFGANQRYVLNGNFTIPDGYSFEELPRNVRMIMPDTGIVFTRMAQVSGDMLTLRYTLDFKKPFYANTEYEEFREFYKKLDGLLNEQFVVKKASK